MMNFSIEFCKYVHILFQGVIQLEKNCLEFRNRLACRDWFILSETLREFMYTILKNNKTIIDNNKKRKSNNLFIYNFLCGIYNRFKNSQKRGKTLLLYQLTVQISYNMGNKCILWDRFMIKSQPMTIRKHRCLIFIDSG